MAYGAGAHDGGGKCPDTHPYRTMSREFQSVISPDVSERGLGEPHSKARVLMNCPVFYEYHFKDDFPYEEGARKS